MSRYLVACDAGGTMTDVIVVDEEGRSVIGKAPTSPQDESIGYMESFWEALEYMGISKDEGQNFGASVETAIYTGTSMLNTVINMSGYKTGIIVTRGFEDIISQGRGSQTFIGAQWSELHICSIAGTGPRWSRASWLVGSPSALTCLVPLSSPCTRTMCAEGARSLIADEKVEAIAIIFLQSFVNPAHENRAAEICREVMEELGQEVVLEVSNKVAPTTREISRANATVVQAYASDPARKQLYRIEEELAKTGYAHSLKTVLGYGGITNIRYPRLFEAAMSGPVGGLMGAKYLSSVIGEENIVCSDVGGTSFDAGTITAGVLPIDREPGFQGHVRQCPHAGDYLDWRRDRHLHSGGSSDEPHQARPRIPRGGRPARLSLEAGNTTPTINDVKPPPGYSFRDQLSRREGQNQQSRLREALQREGRRPPGHGHLRCGGDLPRTPECDDARAPREQLDGRPRSQGIRTSGVWGGGPLHLLGYAGDFPWKAVCTVPHAGGFSAWGGRLHGLLPSPPQERGGRGDAGPG